MTVSCVSCRARPRPDPSARMVSPSAGSLAPRTSLLLEDRQVRCRDGVKIMAGKRGDMRSLAQAMSTDQMKKAVCWGLSAVDSASHPWVRFLGFGR